MVSLFKHISSRKQCFGNIVFLHLNNFITFGAMQPLLGKLNLSLIENLSLTKVGSSPGCSSLDLWSNALTSRFWDQVQDALAWICGVMPWLPRSEKQYLDSSSCRNRDWTLGTVGKKVTFIHAPASYEYFKLCFRSCSSFHLPKNIWYSRKFSSVKCWKTWPPEPFCSNFSCTLSFMGKGGLY